MCVYNVKGFLTRSSLGSTTAKELFTHPVQIFGILNVQSANTTKIRKHFETFTEEIIQHLVEEKYGISSQ